MKSTCFFVFYWHFAFNADVDTSGKREGVYFYRIELPWSYLEAGRPDTFRLKAGLEATQGVVEGILYCQFVPLQHALVLLYE